MFNKVSGGEYKYDNALLNTSLRYGLINHIVPAPCYKTFQAVTYKEKHVFLVFMYHRGRQ